MGRPPQSAENFWSKVDKNGPTPEYNPSLGPCWIWVGYVSKRGYGRVSWGNAQRYAHVIAYELLSGPVPDGKELDHLCRVRHCVRHVEPVTHQQNTVRGIGPSAINAKKTHCFRGHPLTSENQFYWLSQKQRICKSCRKMAWTRANNKRTRRKHELKDK